MNDKDNTVKPIRHGAALVAGGAVGAGMFALPLAAAAGWTFWTLLGLILVCYLTVCAASILLEVHKKFALGSSFHTLVLKTFGPGLAWLNNLSIIFIMLILMYAYITAGGRILQNSLGTDLGKLLSLLFALSIAFMVWLGATLVSRISMVLIAVMATLFLMVTSSLVPQMNIAPLMPVAIWVGGDALRTAIPVFVAAFACGGIVPSLVDYYRGDIARARTSVVRGALLSLLVYTIWVLVCWLLNWFSHFAVITSFLSIALGLVHFLLDRMNLNHTTSNRLIVTLIAFSLPTIASLIAPYGFVTAIAYAGFFVAISFFIIPALLYAKHYRWNFHAGLVLLAGVVVIFLKGWKTVL